jgi:hypothetical protein
MAIEAHGAPYSAIAMDIRDEFVRPSDNFAPPFWWAAHLVYLPQESLRAALPGFISPSDN